MTHQSNPQNQNSPDSIIRHKRSKKINDAIIITLIGAITTMITTIVVGFLGFGPFARLVEQKWFPTPTPSSMVAMAADAAASLDVPTATFTYTSFITVTTVPVNPPVIPTDTLTPPTETPVPPKMVVIVDANKRGGATPLAVKFNAVDSFVQSADGSKTKCNQYNCKYTWSIYDSNQQMIGKPIEWRESFSYTFSQAGLYTVKVSVCQGNVCGVGSITIGAN